MTTYQFHSDPGHGWLEVTRAELVRLGIASTISPYSYQRGGLVYLEEDCDAGAFLVAKKSLGEDFQIKDTSVNDSSPIRSYDSYCHAGVPA